MQYHGQRYSGWQTQKNRTTVQATLRGVLTRLAGTPVSVIGASRTDSGVHALGQVAHFDFQPRPTISNLQRALNAHLPDDIRVVRLEPAEPSFHAQKWARSKLYQYRITSSRILSPFLRGRVCHLPRALQATAMQQAASLVLGSHDFSGFAAASTQVRNRNRTIYCSEFNRKGPLLTYRVEADGFLHHMVRNIVGTFIEVGLGKRKAEDVLRILRSRDRREAGPTAQPQGLYLVKVNY